MPLRNTFSAYGSAAKTFHWLTALLIFTAFPLGYVSNGLAQQIAAPGFDGSQAVIDQATRLFSLHKTLGVAVFFTALLRILWALTQTKPGLLHPDRKAEALAAEAVHWLLYGSLVLVPLTGWIHHAATVGYAPIRWPFGQGLPFVPKSDTAAAVFSALHWLFAWTLFTALALHIAGALKHHVIDRDATLRRMLPGRPAAPQPPAQAHSAAPLITALAVWGAVLAGSAVLGKFTPSHAAQPPAAELAEVQSGWTVETGSLTIGVTQMGSPVSGEFADWTAAISFDEPAAPGPAGTVEVVIAIPSLNLGTVTSQAMGADYFDSAQFPTATFAADINKLAEGYEAKGTLTIRDRTVPVSLPFTLELDGSMARMTGSLTLNRLDFGIGRSLPDESSLAFAVTVNVDLTARRTE